MRIKVDIDKRSLLYVSGLTKRIMINNNPIASLEDNWSYDPEDIFEKLNFWELFGLFLVNSLIFDNKGNWLLIVLIFWFSFNDAFCA